MRADPGACIRLLIRVRQEQHAPVEPLVVAQARDLRRIVLREWAQHKPLGRQAAVVGFAVHGASLCGEWAAGVFSYYNEWRRGGQGDEFTKINAIYLHKYT